MNYKCALKQVAHDIDDEIPRPFWIVPFVIVIAIVYGQNQLLGYIVIGLIISVIVFFWSVCLYGYIMDLREKCK